MKCEAYGERTMDLKEYTEEGKEPKQFAQRRF